VSAGLQMMLQSKVSDAGSMLLDFLHQIVYNAGYYRAVIDAAVSIPLLMPKLL